MKLRDITKIFEKQAKKKKRKIGIGILRPIPETIQSLKKAQKYADIVIVGAKVRGFENIIEGDSDQASKILIKLLKDKKIDGIVRGQVKDSYTFDEFHRQFNKKPLSSNRKLCPAILKKDKYTFVTSTASVYHALNFKDKVYEAEKIIEYIKKDLKIIPKIAVMGILRPTSKHGKYPILDEISNRCKKLFRYLKKRGCDVKEYYMEYETAIWEGRNLIIPSVGFVGNSWLKSLIYLGGWELMACPYLGLGVVYEDGSRNEKDFYWHTVHAVAMANKKFK